MSTVTNSSFIATTVPMKTSPSAKFLADAELIRSPNSVLGLVSVTSPSSNSNPLIQDGITNFGATGADAVFVVAII